MKVPMQALRIEVRAGVAHPHELKGVHGEWHLFAVAS
jgi:hypothetical protein